jgi:transposase
MSRIERINKYLKKFKHLFFLKEHKKGRKRCDQTAVLEALLHKVTFGSPFRICAYNSNISKSTLHKYFSLWTHKGLFYEISLLYKINDDIKSIIIDSTPLNCVNLESNKYNGYKRKKCTKLTVFSTPCHEVIAYELMDGNVNDIMALKEHKNSILKLKPRNFYGDKAYFSDCLQTAFAKQNVKFNVAQKKSRKVYKTRIKIEHLFARLKQYREIERTFMRKLEHVKSNLAIAFTLLQI